MWGDWIAGLRPWDLFGGLTFDQTRYTEWDRFSRSWIPRRIPRDVAVRRFEKWVRESSRALRRRIDYVAAVEYQKNGWPHIHPLLDIRGLSFGDVRTLGTLWFELAGGNKLSRPRDLMSVCTYAAKYLSKEFDRGDVLLSPGLGSVDLKVRRVQEMADRSYWVVEA